MADDKKNILDAGEVDESSKPGKVEPAKAALPVQDQPALAKAEAPMAEGSSKVVRPFTAEKPVEGKTAPAPCSGVTGSSRLGAYQRQGYSCFA